MIFLFPQEICHQILAYDDVTITDVENTCKAIPAFEDASHSLTEEFWLKKYKNQYPRHFDIYMKNVNSIARSTNIRRDLNCIEENFYPHVKGFLISVFDYMMKHIQSDPNKKHDIPDAVFEIFNERIPSILTEGLTHNPEILLIDVLANIISTAKNNYPFQYYGKRYYDYMVLKTFDPKSCCTMTYHENIKFLGNIIAASMNVYLLNDLVIDSKINNIANDFSTYLKTNGHNAFVEKYISPDLEYENSDKVLLISEVHNFINSFIQGNSMPYLVDTYKRKEFCIHSMLANREGDINLQTLLEAAILEKYNLPFSACIGEELIIHLEDPHVEALQNIRKMDMLEIHTIIALRCFDRTLTLLGREYPKAELYNLLVQELEPINASAMLFEPWINVDNWKLEMLYFFGMWITKLDRLDKFREVQGRMCHLGLLLRRDLKYWINFGLEANVPCQIRGFFNQTIRQQSALFHHAQEELENNNSFADYITKLSLEDLIQGHSKFKQKRRTRGFKFMVENGIGEAVEYAIGQVVEVHEFNHETISAYSKENMDKFGIIYEWTVVQHPSEQGQFLVQYKLLLDDCNTALVWQSSISLVTDFHPINHPHIGRYFLKYRPPIYIPNLAKAYEYPEDASIREIQLHPPLY